MPPKQKRKASTSVTAERKSKRQKISDKETSAIDSGFQNPNIDVTKYILDNLKLVTKDLKALSETCSSWHVKITTYYREMFAHTLPFSYKKYKGAQRQEIMEEIARVRKHVSEIQVLHFNREKLSQRFNEDTEITDAVSIPWCTRIILALEFTGWEIIDLKKQDPILKFPIFEHDQGSPSYSINTKRKELLLMLDVYVYDDDEWNDKQSSDDENDNGLESLKHIIRIYNISDDGKVELAKKSEIKVYGHTKAVILRDDGSVWRATEKRIELLPNPGDSKSYEIYKYTGKLGQVPDQNIMDFIELNGALKFIVQDMSDKTNPATLIYDAKTKTSQELPVKCVYRDSYYITYISDSLQFNGGNFPGSCNLDPIIQPEIEPLSSNECDVSVSPDGSRILEYKPVFQNVQIALKDKSAKRTAKGQKYHSILQSSILFYSKEEKEEEEVPIVAEKKKKKRKKKSISYGKKKKKQIVEEFIEIDPEGIKFWWLSNDIVIATYDNRIAILDFRSAPPSDGFLSFEAPLVDDDEVMLDTSLFARIDDISFVIVNVRDCKLLGIKIKIYEDGCSCDCHFGRNAIFGLTVNKT